MYFDPNGAALSTAQGGLSRRNFLAGVAVAATDRKSVV